ncbi:glycosyltransferase-like domain-containing protein 1 isoform X2 [Ornithorhynchus anatinus]|nr:glycosyltransferase-like domain-containing protein 1 isoform X2 [Ornithorhynchus anatinus]
MSVLMIEAFYGGSHKQLVDLLHRELGGCVLYTLPAKKWPWRARTAALYFSQVVAPSPEYRILFASSVLNLAELAALRPDLGKLRKILYFHENQLVYPVRKCQERDFQFGYNQILSCLVADAVVFNSAFNMESFLASMGTFTKLIPDHRPEGLEDAIRPKCRVLHFPIRFPDVSRFLPGHKLGRREITPGEKGNQETSDSGGAPSRLAGRAEESLMENRSVEWETQSEPEGERPPDPSTPAEGSNRAAAPARATRHQVGDEQRLTSDLGGNEDPQKPLHIVWPHRWEHDKGPELFFKTLLRLKEAGLTFHVSVLGETFSDVPGWKPCTAVASPCVPKLWSIRKSFQLNICIRHLNSFLKGSGISVGDQILYGDISIRARRFGFPGQPSVENSGLCLPQNLGKICDRWELSHKLAASGGMRRTFQRAHIYLIRRNRKSAEEAESGCLS